MSSHHLPVPPLGSANGARSLAPSQARRRTSVARFPHVVTDVWSKPFCDGTHEAIDSDGTLAN